MAQAMPFITAGLGAASTLNSAQDAAAQRKAQNARVAQQQHQMALRQRIEERRLERKRKSELASARARLGAAGTGTTGGSGAAVLRGLNQDFDQELQDSRSLFNAQMAGTQNLLNTRSGGLGTALSLSRNLLGLGSHVFGTLSEPKSGGDLTTKIKG